MASTDGTKQADHAGAGEPKWFNCQACGKALSAHEVVPIFMDGCCGFIAACSDCAQPTGSDEALG